MKLSFKSYPRDMRKSKGKIKGFGKDRTFHEYRKKKIFMNAFFNALFSYCPLTWMFHSRKLNNKINRIHEKCLHIITINNHNLVSVHYRNIQIPATELYKIVNRLSPDIMKALFPLKNNLSYYTRNRKTLHSWPIRPVTCGSKTLSYFAPKLWELVLPHIKSLHLLLLLKVL